MIMIESSVKTTAENRDQCIEAMKRRMKETHQEKGWLTYRFTADLEDPMIFHMLELWEDEAAFKEHLKVPATLTFGPELDTMSENIHSAVLSGPMSPYTITL